MILAKRLRRLNQPADLVENNLYDSVDALILKAVRNRHVPIVATSIEDFEDLLISIH